MIYVFVKSTNRLCTNSNQILLNSFLHGSRTQRYTDNELRSITHFPRVVVQDTTESESNEFQMRQAGSE